MCHGLHARPPRMAGRRRDDALAKIVHRSAARIRWPDPDFPAGRSRGDTRFEIEGAAKVLAPKSLGCFTDIIAYRSRSFVPPERAVATVRAILDHYLVAEAA